MEGIPLYDLIASPLGFGATIIGHILMAIVLTGVAAKTDEKDAWWAWVPFLNIAYMLRLARMSWLWMIPAVVPVFLWFTGAVLLAVIVVAWWKIAERCQKPGALGLLMWIPFVNVLVGLHIAFSK